MEHYSTNYSKCCSNCRCNYFIIREGYIICSNCGFIVESFTNEGFYTIGYLPLGRKRKRSKKKKELNITNRI
ncbi:MAG: hypothetical protein J6Y42_00915 [Bacilli bacterium]|nr:hypothetical protein [Bacilli bacterium]